MRPNTDMNDLQHRKGTGHVVANENSSISGSPAPEDRSANQAMADTD